MRRAIPDGFVLGVATSAFQIEGSANADGRGASIWDAEAISSGADHYPRMEEDLDLVHGLGVDAYRFSVAWPRVIPQGRGEVNSAGLDFYDRLVDGLLERGISPTTTLYHWDLPLALAAEGGWAARSTAQAFAEFAAVVAERLGDRVDLWCTICEPWCVAFLGYASGLHAPKRREPEAALAAAHHLNLGHGWAVQAVRAAATNDPAVTAALNVHALRPFAPDDLEHVQRLDRVANQIFTGPMLGTGYPEQLLEDTREISDWAFVRRGDEAVARQPLDVLGLNYYSPHLVRRRRDGEPESPLGSPWPGSPDLVVEYPAGPATGVGWTIDPSGLSDLLARMSSTYPNLPLVITENGAAYPDRGPDDHDRVAYLRQHLGAVLEARDSGVDVRGYYVWSLLDNIEWTLGSGPRFGLFSVDYETFERSPRASARWFAALARQRTLT